MTVFLLVPRARTASHADDDVIHGCEFLYGTVDTRSSSNDLLVRRLDNGATVSVGGNMLVDNEEQLESISQPVAVYEEASSSPLGKSLACSHVY